MISPLMTWVSELCHTSGRWPGYWSAYWSTHWSAWSASHSTELPQWATREFPPWLPQHLRSPEKVCVLLAVALATGAIWIRRRRRLSGQQAGQAGQAGQRLGTSAAGSASGEFGRGISSSRHRWLSFMVSPQPRYCNYCERLVSVGWIWALFPRRGLECQICGLVAHLSCQALASRTSCKRAQHNHSHQLRKGNLPANAECAFCGLVCTSNFSLCGMQCLWCQRCFHERCLLQSSQLADLGRCSLGPFATLILPPSLTSRPSAPAQKADDAAAQAAAPVKKCASEPVLNPFPSSDESTAENDSINRVSTDAVYPDAMVTANASFVDLKQAETKKPFPSYSAAPNPTQAWTLYCEADTLKPAPLASELHLLREAVERGGWSKKAPEEFTQFRSTLSSVYARIANLYLELGESRPLLVFVNPKSGGQLGQSLVYEASRLLNPCQVVNLRNVTPRTALEALASVASAGKLQVLSCGGDGTAGWILESIHTVCQSCCIAFRDLVTLYDDIVIRNHSPPEKFLFQEICVPLAIAPMGTGNDLAIVLGWGATFDLRLPDFLRRLRDSSVRGKVDLWTLKCVSPKPKKKKLPVLETRVFCNYLDVGIAARIALKFHRLRETHPEIFTSRIANKFLYGEVGVRDFLLDETLDLSNTEIQCDDRIVATPSPLEGIAVVNIPSFAGTGESLWTPRGVFDEKEVQSISDGQIEVVGFRSLLHLGQLQVGMARAARICRGRSVTIKLKQDGGAVPIQVDGEPRLLPPNTEIRIEHAFAASVLFATPAVAVRHGHVGRVGRAPTSQTASEDALDRLLRDAVKDGLISVAQGAVLRKRLAAPDHASLP